MTQTRLLTLAFVPAWMMVLVLLSGPTLSQPAQSAEHAETAKNIILLIGDGVDVHQLTIARAYLYGQDGSLSFDQFPHQASARVRTVSDSDGETPVWVPDSASTGSAIAAGLVTSQGRISTTAKTDRDVPTILEIAQSKKRRTGVVSTASITDATPSVFMAHTSVRFCQGPNDMDGTSQGLPGCPKDLKAAGGAGSIAEQIAVADVDVLLGGGTRYFSQRGEDGEIVLEQMTRAGYTLVSSGAQLADFVPDGRGRLLGLFGNSTLPTEWAGVGGRSAEEVELTDDGPVYPEPVVCQPNPNFGKRPTLVEMTKKAIEVLAKAPASSSIPVPGFFLMVESASIDKQAHAMNPCGQIGETKALSDAVKVAMEFAAGRDDTLIIVTSDHGHAPQLIAYPSLFAAFAPNSKVPMYPPGRVALLEPEFGGIMAISYGTNAKYIQEHTGTQIPVYAMGPGASRVKGLINQSDLFGIMKLALGE